MKLLSQKNKSINQPLNNSKNTNFILSQSPSQNVPCHIEWIENDNPIPFYPRKKIFIDQSLKDNKNTFSQQIPQNREDHAVQTIQMPLVIEPNLFKKIQNRVLMLQAQTKQIRNNLDKSYKSNNDWKVKIVDLMKGREQKLSEYERIRQKYMTRIKELQHNEEVNRNQLLKMEHELSTHKRIHQIYIDNKRLCEQIMESNTQKQKPKIIILKDANQYQRKLTFGQRTSHKVKKTFLKEPQTVKNNQKRRIRTKNYKNINNDQSKHNMVSPFQVDSHYLSLKQ